jgi:hypothetical protein
VTPAEALVSELRERGLGGEVAGDWVRVTVPGLPLTPLLITPASRAGTGPMWCWRRGGQSWSHPRDDPGGAADKIAASLRPPPGPVADSP